VASVERSTDFSSHYPDQGRSDRILERGMRAASGQQVDRRGKEQNKNRIDSHQEAPPILSGLPLFHTDSITIICLGSLWMLGSGPDSVMIKLSVSPPRLSHSLRSGPPGLKMTASCVIFVVAYFNPS
jgi:hypothetical protein